VGENRASQVLPNRRKSSRMVNVKVRDENRVYRGQVDAGAFLSTRAGESREVDRRCLLVVRPGMTRQADQGLCWLAT